MPIENDPFEKYYRESELDKIEKGIHETTEYLELFLRNLLLGEHNVLKNRYLHIRWSEIKQDIEDEKQDIGDKKQDIQNEKQDIEGRKQDIEDLNQDIRQPEEIRHLMMKAGLSSRTKNHIETLFKSFGMGKIFGREDVAKELGITVSPASALIKKMKDLGLIDPMKGFGKGKYRFRPM